VLNEIPCLEDIGMSSMLDGVIISDRWIYDETVLNSYI